MKALFKELNPDAKWAPSFLALSLSICAHDHILSRKLLTLCSGTSGRFAAIYPPLFDVDRIDHYDHITRECAQEPYDEGFSAIAILVAFVREYLVESDGRIVVCENWGWNRDDVARQPWPPPRVACYGENEVFHLLTKDITNYDDIEATVKDRHHWQTGLCTECIRVPDGDIPGEPFLEELVNNTRNVFIPAFDATGYLIWTKQE